MTFDPTITLGVVLHLVVILFAGWRAVRRIERRFLGIERTVGILWRAFEHERPHVARLLQERQ